MYVYHLLDKFWVPRSLKGLIRYYGIGSSEAQFNYEKNEMESKSFFFLETTLFITTIACFPHPLYQQGEGKPAIVIKRGGYKMK